MKYQYIDPDKISNMLFDEDEYIIEFCEAGVSSFKEFVENFETHLTNRNMKNLRKAGHKIKPGAKMMGADEVVEEYEHAKSLLQNDADTEELVQSTAKMKEICATIQDELSDLAQNIN